MKKTGIELIAIEREEQFEKHGRSIDNDIRDNSTNQLTMAASILCVDYPYKHLTLKDIEEYQCPATWDKELWKKMVNKSYKERLVIAGALIAAEIDRLQAE